MDLKKSGRSLALIIMVFFFWGFVAASNTVLIGLFRESFELSQFQSQLVDWAFYIAYFAGSLVYFLITVLGYDLLNKIGYKRGLIVGLCISALGALGFIPAADYQSFALMLTSLFVVGIGFSLQQIVANPYVIALGTPETGSHRVSLAGGINSLGTTIGPLLVSYAIFGNITGENTASMGVEGVKLPYFILCAAFVLVALILGFSKLPAITNQERIERGAGALQFPQLRWGMLAIFIYVGVEVSIQSNMPELMKAESILGLPTKSTVHFISLYWGSLMIGRWGGAITAFNLSKETSRVLMVLVPILAYLVVVGVNYIKFYAAETPEKTVELLYYFPFILLLIAGTLLGKEKPAKTLLLFSLLALLMMIVGLFTSGYVALYFFISGGLFCSIMWPCIFSLSLAGLGKYTNQGSAFLIMMILGGGVVPLIQGALADFSSIHLSYWIPVVCFAILLFYSVRVKSILRQQGIDYDREA